jgi:hypothetical protein
VYTAPGGGTNNLTLTIDRPKLTQVNEKRLMQAAGENRE